MADSEKKQLRLTCPICQTRLKVAEDITRFNCLNCGTEVDVIKEENEARLQPTAAAVAKLTPAELELAEVNRSLKEKDDSYGVGCVVATLAVTLVSCVLLLVANAMQNTAIFWISIAGALLVMGFILFVFIVSSNRETSPLVRKRDQLLAEIEQQRDTPDSFEVQGSEA